MYEDKIVNLMKDERPNFENTNKALKVMEALTVSSEAHGLLCALFSFGVEVKFAIWLNSLMIKSFKETDSVAISALQIMKKLFDYTKLQFEEKSLNLDLFIPEDSEELSYRCECLGDWVKGFLSGIGVFGFNYENTANQEIKEIIQDLMEVSYVDYDALDREDGSEADFMELLEYTRVAVLLIYGEKI